MRIIYLHQYFAFPEASSGTRSWEIARRLIQSGHSVHMLCSSALLPGDPASKRWIYRTEKQGLQLSVLDVKYSNKMGFWRRIMSFFSYAVLASYEICRLNGHLVFATSTPLTIAIPAIVGKLFHGVPMVLEIRDLWPELPIAIGALRNPLLKWLARALEKTAYSRADHVVALSPGMAAGVKRVCPWQSVTVIPNACDVDLFQKPAEDEVRHLRARLKLEMDEKLVLYAGTLGRINGVHFLVELAKRLRTTAPEVRFLIIGDGAEKRTVTDLAREYGVLNNNLSIWPPLPKLQMPAVFALSTVSTSLFVPLREMWNNSANKFFDSLASFTPLAINYAGWQAEILKSSGAGIVLPSDNLDEASKMLASLVRSEERLGSARKAAQELATREFDRDRLVQVLEEKLTEIYRKDQKQKTDRISHLKQE